MALTATDLQPSIINYQFTTAKWTIADYHRTSEAGILEYRHVELLKSDLYRSF